MVGESITSTSVISLTMGELLAILTCLVGIIGGVIAFARKDERDKARLDQNEKDISKLTEQVSKLTETVQHLMLIVKSKSQPTRNLKSNVP